MSMLWQVLEVTETPLHSMILTWTAVTWSSEWIHLMAGTGSDRNPPYTPWSLPGQWWPGGWEGIHLMAGTGDDRNPPTLHDPYLDSSNLELRMNPPHGWYWRWQKSGPNALQGTDLDSGDLGVEKESAHRQVLNGQLHNWKDVDVGVVEGEV